MENEIVKFEAGKTYYYRFISSYDTVVKCTIIKLKIKLRHISKAQIFCQNSFDIS